MHPGRNVSDRPPPGIPPRAAGPGAAIFTLVLLVVGVLVGRYVRLLPVQASDRSVAVDELFSTMLGVAATIFLLVVGLLLYVTLRFRRKKGQLGDGLPIHGSKRLEVAWTLVPALVALWLAVYSSQILVQFRPAPQDELVVEVTAFQFDWEFFYPEFGIVSQDLYLPAGQAVRLKLTSRDVIHSVWVPEFRLKQDALPGRVTEIQFTATALGRYRVICAELCGSGHALMGLLRYAVVLSPPDFNAWVYERLAPAESPTSPADLIPN